MTLVLSGTNGVSSVDGSAATPAIQGADTNTGIFFPAADTIAFAEGGAEVARFNSSGNLGVGVSSPVSRLDVREANRANSTNITNVGVYTTTAQAADVGGTIGLGGIFSSSNGYAPFGSIRGGKENSTDNNYTGYLAFQTIKNGEVLAERARIDSSGRLIVGSTASNGDGSIEGVARTNATPAVVAGSRTSGDVASAALLVTKFDNNSTTSQVFQRFAINNNAIASGQINANGASQAAFGSWSDARLKENIVDLEPQLEKVMALRPVEFDYKNGSGHQTGFLAQEMREVYPDAVGEQDGFLTMTGYGKTEARLIKAIQELTAKLDAAEARIAALEAK